MREGVRKPAALRRGDRIAVVAPSAVVDPARLEAGMAVLARRGFELVPPSCHEPYRFFSARDADRFADLRAAFDAPDVKAVWFARGGYGMNRLLPMLDAAWLRERARLCIGFSDATALLQWLVLGAGVPALHGPMVAHDLEREDATGGLDHLLSIAEGASSWQVDVPCGLVTGAAEAPLLGGCLAVLASLAGTPHAPSFAGTIALLEDTHERPQRKLDRMLVQLRQAGILDGVRGVVFGTMPDCGEPEEIRETIVDCLSDLGVPIGFGAPVGHGDAHLAVPFGVRVRLEIGSRGEGVTAPAGALIGRESVVAG